MRSPARLIALLLAFLSPSTACVGGGQDAGSDPRGGGGKADEGGEGAPRLQWCAGHEHVGTPTGQWNHHSSSTWSSLGKPRHTVQDVVGNPGTVVTIGGKFAYGVTSKDLEDEWVNVFVHDCQGYRLVAQALTDDDGRVQVELDTTDLPAGVYDLQLEVAADASFATAKLWLLPAGTHVTVSDIDGTLTTSDAQLVIDLFDDILAGSYVPHAYPGGPALTSAHADHGEILVYLTGRPYSLTDSSRQWLAELGFAPGILHTTDSSGEGFPANSGVGEYKRAYLQALLDAGLVIDAAYGNASTDIYAYAEAGIDPADTWIIGPHAGEDGTNAADGTWEPRAAEVQSGPDAEQPFAW